MPQNQRYSAICGREAADRGETSHGRRALTTSVQRLWHERFLVFHSEKNSSCERMELSCHRLAALKADVKGASVLRVSQSARMTTR